MGAEVLENGMVECKDMMNCKSSRRFYFFKQKTAYEIRNCDWSSDVCSSDLKE